MRIHAFIFAIDLASSSFVTRPRPAVDPEWGVPYHRSADSVSLTVPSSDFWSEDTELGKITFRRRLHSGFASLVFQIDEHPDLVIKYRVDDCLGGYSDVVHPLVGEYNYMRNASLAGLAPRPIFLSASSTLCESKEGKCEFAMSESHYKFCRDANAMIRYMIMEKAHGVSLHEFRRTRFPEGKMGLRNALNIGATLIDMIGRLHLEAKVVHGDIHSPNIMISMDPKTEIPHLALIDFGRAFTYPDRDMNESSNHTSSHFLASKTHWQIQGFSTAPRDDVLKALQTTAQIMHPFDFFDFENTLTRMGELSLLNWKMKANWFTASPFDSVAELVGVSDTIKIELRTRLLNVLNRVRELGINEPIPYRDIADELRQCASLAQV